MSRTGNGEDSLRRAMALDRASREKDAIPHYRRAIARRLPTSDLRDALIGLGSSLREVGQLQSSIRTLKKARRLFPRDPAITMFLALSHFDAGQEGLATRQLADALLNECTRKELEPYRRALIRKFHALRRRRRRSS